MNPKGKRDPIPGYTGCMLPKPEQQITQMQQIAADGQVPGYVGFIPSIRAENLYGKTYGRITEDCYHGQYYQGGELPSDIRFMSTTKQAFVDPKAIKDKEALEGKINGLKTSTFYGVAKNILGTSSGFNPHQNQAQSKLTYEQAVKLAYKS